MKKEGYSKNIMKIILIISFIVLIIIATSLISIPKNNIKEDDNISNNEIPEDIIENSENINNCNINLLKFNGKSFEDSVVLYLPFDNDIKDASKNKNMGVCLTTSCPTKNSDVRYVGFYTFDGNDYLQYNGLMGKPTEFTLFGFGNLNSPDKQGSELISIGDYASIRLDSDGNLSGNYHYNGGWLSTGNPSTYAEDDWHQFAYVFKNKEYQELYVDGTLVSKTNYPKPIYYAGLSSMNTFIGKNGNGNTNFDFNGSIDNIMVFNNALLSEEIENLYNCLSSNN